MRGATEALSRIGAAETGFFGKVASQGDFVANRFDRGLRDLLDRWLQKSLDHEQRQRGETWKASFARMPAWRFVLGAEAGARMPVLGVMVPSADRVGRAFPLFIAARLPGYRGPTRALCGERRWFEAAEALLRNVASPAFDLDAFDRNLVILPKLEGPQQAYRDLAQEADRSFWWTEERRLDGRRFAATGLPAPETFGRFLGPDQEGGRDAQAAPEVSIVPRRTPPRPAPRAVRPPMRMAVASHPGTRLRLNADRFTHLELPHLQALADGLGDTATAGQAADLVIERLSRIEPSDLVADMLASAKGALGTVNTLLRAGPATEDAPSAAVVALITTVNAFAVVWAGDARLYLLRDGMMRALTRDHVEVGLQRRLSRSVGGAAQFACDTLTDDLQAGDRFLLVTGPLPRIVPERLIAQRLATLPTDELPEALIQEALVAGAPENVSAFAVAFGADEAP